MSKFKFGILFLVLGLVFMFSAIFLLNTNNAEAVSTTHVLENSYLESRMLTYKKNGIAFGTTHIHAFTEKNIYAIDYRIVDEITRKVVRLKTYEDGIYSSDEYKHYVVIHVVMPGTSDACDVEIELNEYQVQMVLDNYPTFRIGSNVNDGTVVTEAKKEVTVV